MVHPPILEFDTDRTAIIEPSAWHHPIDELPERAVLTWMPDAFAAVVDSYGREERYRFVAESCSSPVHELDIGPTPVLVALAPVGAPAAAALLESLIAIGVRATISIGSSGGLTRDLAPGTVVVPPAAIRDEGVSYHYAAPARLAKPDPGFQAALAQSFAGRQPTPSTGLVWTTDALFRETSARVESRIGEGAVAVDMEVAALAAVATYREIRYGTAVYLADTLHSDEWDPSGLVNRDTPFRTDLVETVAKCLAAIDLD